MTEKYIPVGDGARYYPTGIPNNARPPFAENANRVATITFDLGTAREAKRVEITGTILWALAATDLNAEIDIRYNDQLGQAITFQQGMFIRGVSYDELYISNDSQPGKSITFLYAVEGVENISIENPLIAFQSVTLQRPSNYVGSNDLTLAPLNAGTIAADGTRYEVDIQADIGNGSDLVELRDPVNRVFAKLAAGDSMTVVGTGAIMVKNPSSTNNVSYRYLVVST